MDKAENCICARSWPRLEIRRGRLRLICVNCGRRAPFGKDIEEAIENWNKDTYELASIWGRR